MKNSITKFTVLALVLAATAVAYPTVGHAGGIVGDGINMIVPGLGTQLDQLNAQAGQPFDKAAAAALAALLSG